MHIGKGTRFCGLVLACAILVATNVHCGEYLLLHYLITPGWQSSPKAEATQVDEFGEVQKEPLPPAEAETLLPECLVEADRLPVTKLPVPVQVPNCLEGDLNKDGKVDGLDVQVLVNCLLKQ